MTLADNHFDRLADLLELESQAEARQMLEQMRRRSPEEAEAAGHCLAALVVQDEYAGLGGRLILTLAKRDRSPLPWTRLGAGTPVLLSEHKGRAGEGWRGVVSERGEASLRVAFDEPPDGDRDGTLFRVDAAHDEAARLRQRQALQRAAGAKRERLAELRAVLLGEAPPAFDPLPPFSGGSDREGEAPAEPGDAAPDQASSEPGPTSPGSAGASPSRQRRGDTPLRILDASLNESQREAVRLALAARDVAVIHGPPGTGKTTTVVEVIRQAVRRGDQVLVCAPSNLAVDNLLERLLAFGEKAVRLGHPARVLPALREHTLDLLVEEHGDVRLARKFAKEAYALFRQASKWTRAKPEPGARRDLRQEGRALLADARRLEEQTVQHILDTTPILCATTTGLDAGLLGPRRFDLLVLDEACQTTEPGCWVPLLRAERVVLAGDHCQLPPTVLSVEAARQGFGVSLLERLVALHGERVTRRLRVQYRMHDAIMTFSAREFYEGDLQADASVSGHRLCDLPGVAAGPLTETPLQFLDTAGAGFDEELEPDGESRLNPREAELVAKKVRQLLEAGVAPADVAVIAPYSAQVRRLRELLPVAGLEIDSVDGFQGREKEAVVLSLVRSNAEGEIGFLADVRRMNVALTRPRRKLLVVGDSATLAVLPFYGRLIEYFESAGAYSTVWEEGEV
jgi:hypothetical protein